MQESLEKLATTQGWNSGGIIKEVVVPNYEPSFRYSPQTVTSDSLSRCMSLAAPEGSSVFNMTDLDV